MWVILSSITSVFFGAQSILIKYISRSGTNRQTLFFFNFIPFILVWPVYLLLRGVPKTNPVFWYSLSVSFALNIIAVNLYFKAIYTEDISIVMPLISTSPFFLLITSFIILGEKPDTSGVLGILLITMGTYLISLGADFKDILSPLRLLFRSQGARYALFTAFIWSITSNFDKKAIVATDALTYSLTITLLFLIFALIVYRKHIVFKPTRLLGVYAMVQLIMILAQFSAVKYTLVSYVIAFKRAGMLLSVVYGGLILKEQNLIQRFVGSAFILGGVFLILL